jgi:serine/threonine protein kinase
MANTPWLAELLLQWEEGQEQGKDHSAEELCRECPDLAPLLAQRIAALKRMNWLGQTTRRTEGPTGPPILPSSHLRLEHLIGEGGFGQVWAGYDLRLKRLVAVKVFGQAHLGSLNWREYLRHEAERVVRLEHPGIVPLLEMGEGDRLGYLVFPLILGGSLRQLLRQVTRVPAGQAARIVADVAKALDHAHHMGVVHRDVKPDNILLDRKSRVYLTDFGIAIRKGDWRRRPLGGAGTLAYMGPEQIRDAEIQERRRENEDAVATIPHIPGPHGVWSRVDPRSDIYSIGVVLYELLTGRPPFAGKWNELRQAILSRRPEPPRSVEPAIAPGLERICLRCLAKDPRDRYIQAMELAADLRGFLEHQVDQAGPRAEPPGRLPAFPGLHQTRREVPTAPHLTLACVAS